MRAVVWGALLVVSCDGHTRQSEPRDQGGAGNGNVSSAGSVSIGGSAAAPMQDCRAMDARRSLDNCSDVVGYAFDGKLCGPIVCGCLGDDCGQLFGSLEACDREYGVCYAQGGIDQKLQVAFGLPAPVAPMLPRLRRARCRPNAGNQSRQPGARKARGV